MSQTIKAAVALPGLVTEVREFPVPDIPADGGLLKVERTGICGSDWPYFVNYTKTKGPMILGHETVGRVERAGKGTFERWGVKDGDRVALEEYLPCGYCRYCRTGDFRLCDATDSLIGNGIRYGSTPVDIAPSLWGGYAEYQYLHPRAVFHRIPDHVSAEQATLALPLGNGVEWAVLKGQAGIGDAVVIQGPGQQGLACTLAAKEAGASVIIVTGLAADAHRLALAKEFGATHTVNIDEHDLLQAVADITGGHMADLVIDCASGGPATIISAINLVRKGGRVLLGGRKGVPIENFESDVIFKKAISIIGVRGHSYDAVEMAIGIIASGRFALDKMCTHTFNLSSLTEALHTVAGKREPAIHCSVLPTV